MTNEDSIFIASGGKRLGDAIGDVLRRQGFGSIIYVEPDLRDAAAVDGFFATHKPAHVFLTAGKSGGIAANQKYPAELIFDNLVIECNVIGAAHRHGVRRLLYLASSCCYPRECAQPMKEEFILTGSLEPTNEAYAVAKIAGIKLCEAFRAQHGTDFICGIPANPYGPGDDFSPDDSHVIAALIRRTHEAKISGAPGVEIWGTGAARREFIYIDDLADAAVFAMLNYNGTGPINLGCGEAASIAELAGLIKEVVGYNGELVFDTTKPDGMPVKILDSTKLLSLGWKSRTTLKQGLENTYKWFLDNLC